MSDTPRDCKHGHLARACEICQLESENATLRKTLQVFAECDLNDGNCASLEVASNRIRTLARAAIAKAEGKP